MTMTTLTPLPPPGRSTFRASRKRNPAAADLLRFCSFFSTRRHSRRTLDSRHTSQSSGRIAHATGNRCPSDESSDGNPACLLIAHPRIPAPGRWPFTALSKLSYVTTCPPRPSKDWMQYLSTPSTLDFQAQISPTGLFASAYYHTHFAVRSGSSMNQNPEQ